MGKLTTALAGCAVTILLLSGCSGGTPDEPPSPAEGVPAAETEDGSGSPTDCLIDRNWMVDVDDLAGQLKHQMESLGSPVSSVTGTGTMTIMFAEESLVTTAVDLTFVVVVPVEDAPTLTVTQTQKGSGYGSWFWDGGVDNLVVFEDWVGEYDIQMTMTSAGVTIESPIELPTSAAGGSDMTVTCVGETLTTNAEGNPFTQFWTEG
ncbi:hypothetical protein [Homoserinimonas sp. A520]